MRTGQSLREVQAMSIYDPTYLPLWPGGERALVAHR